jgi:hypothetical protein
MEGELPTTPASSNRDCLANARAAVQKYPRQFQQRHDPDGFSLELQLLVADEPTTALDVTVQAQLLLSVQEIREEHREHRSFSSPTIMTSWLTFPMERT